MEKDEIIYVSESVEIHPDGRGNYAVVRDGRVYGSGYSLDHATQLAEELARGVRS